jgi:hypothetical protein
MSDRTSALVSHVPAVRRNPTDASDPTHPWPKFGPGLRRSGRCRTGRVTSLIYRRPAWH